MPPLNGMAITEEPDIVFLQGTRELDLRALGRIHKIAVPVVQTAVLKFCAVRVFQREGRRDGAGL